MFYVIFRTNTKELGRLRFLRFMWKNERKMNLDEIRVVQNYVFYIFSLIHVLQILHLHLEFLREAPHIDFVHTKRHMDVRLETPPPYKRHALFRLR